VTLSAASAQPMTSAILMSKKRIEPKNTIFGGSLNPSTTEIFL